MATDGKQVRLTINSEYGQAGSIRTVAPGVATFLVAQGKATIIGDAPVDYAPAQDSGASFRAIQSAVLAKAGLTEVSPGVIADHNPEPKPVNIKMAKSGAVLSVHHDVAIQRIVRGDATLA